MSGRRKTFEAGEEVRAKPDTWGEWRDATYEGPAAEFPGWHRVRFLAGGIRRVVPLRRINKKEGGGR